MEYVDIAGLVKGASEGEGLGNKFLSHIREVDAIVEVVRCFEDDDVVHVSGSVDPVEDARTINLELALADMAQIERRMERLEKASKGRNKEEAERSAMEAAALRVINAALEEGNAARTVIGDIGDEERKLVDQLCLLTAKPLIYAANVDEMSLADGGASNALVGTLREYAEQDGAEVVVVSAKVEAELQQLEPEEKEEFLADLGCTEGGLPRLIGATYRNLGLRTYFTSGEKETRAWTIRNGMTAPQAAGVIHTDFEKGFIRAETVRASRPPRTARPHRSRPLTRALTRPCVRRAPSRLPTRTSSSIRAARARRTPARCGSRGRSTWCRRATCSFSGARAAGSPSDRPCDRSSERARPLTRVPRARTRACAHTPRARVFRFNV